MIQPFFNGVRGPTWRQQQRRFKQWFVDTLCGGVRIVRGFGKQDCRGRHSFRTIGTTITATSVRDSYGMNDTKQSIDGAQTTTSGTDAIKSNTHKNGSGSKQHFLVSVSSMNYRRDPETYTWERLITMEDILGLSYLIKGPPKYCKGCYIREQKIGIFCLECQNKREANAATKIQAMVRGHLVRKLDATLPGHCDECGVICPTGRILCHYCEWNYYEEWEELMGAND